MLGVVFLFLKSDSRTALAGARAKAKANLATAIPELIQIATNVSWEENRKEKHSKRANSCKSCRK